jgi:hypothetical protein
MADTNPFEAMRGSDSNTALMSDDATLYLAQTRPWLLFMSVLMFLGAGLMVLGGLFMMIGGFAGGNDPALAMMGPGIGLVYIFFALLYAVPAWLMMQQVGAIGEVQAGGGTTALAAFLRHNRNFWRVIGGFTLVVLVLYCVVFGLMFAMLGSLATML